MFVDFFNDFVLFFLKFDGLRTEQAKIWTIINRKKNWQRNMNFMYSHLN